MRRVGADPPTRLTIAEIWVNLDPLVGPFKSVAPPRKVVLLMGQLSTTFVFVSILQDQLMFSSKGYLMALFFVNILVYYQIEW